MFRHDPADGLARIVADGVCVMNSRYINDLYANEPVVFVTETLPIWMISHQCKALKCISSSKKMQHIAWTLVGTAVDPIFMVDEVCHAIYSRTFIKHDRVVHRSKRPHTSVIWFYEIFG